MEAEEKGPDVLDEIRDDEGVETGKEWAKDRNG